MENPNKKEPNTASPAEPGPSAAVAEALNELENEPTPSPFDAQPETKAPKSKKGLAVFCGLMCLAIIGVSVWFLGTRNAGNSNTSVQNNVEPVPALEPIPASKLALRGNELSEFDLAFLRLENKTENVVYSPLSIKYALAMLADGANGRSKEQITAVIGDYKPQAYLNSANRSLANAMFIRTDFSEQVKAEFKDTLSTKYNAEVILDPFTSPDNANKWVEDKTLGIIKNTFSSENVNPELDYLLVNALAIDMKWKNKLQCATDYNATEEEKVPCISYSAYYPHVNYSDTVGLIEDEKDFPKITFNNKETYSAKIAATYFKYDLITENGGEEAVRNIVQQKYDEWVADVKNNPNEHPYAQIDDFDLDKYMEEISGNYNKNAVSSDFYYLDNDTEKVFAKDLQEYDGSTLQYIGIMPKSGSLNAYLNNLTAEKASELIANLKDISDESNFKEGVVTKLNGNIPFFKFNFTMENFVEDLEGLGITDIFNTQTADLSNMLTFEKNDSANPYINVAIHKADIDFSNNGIKAAAVTAFGGKGAGGGEYFDYKWDVPVEEIDLTFDKPFLFLIRDKGTGEIWFTGTVYEGKTAE